MDLNYAQPEIIFKMCKAGLTEIISELTDNNNENSTYNKNQNKKK